MRLLFFIHSLDGGGAERVTASLANHWVQQGRGVTIVTVARCARDAYVLDPAVERIELDLARQSANRLAGLVQNLRRIWRLRRVLKQRQPDIAIAMMTESSISLAWAALGLRGLGTIGCERIHPPQHPLGSLWETLRRYSYGALSAVVALTQESADWIRKNTKARRVDVIPNAANWPLPELLPRIEPDAIFPAHRRLVLAVGRLEVQKGFDWLIEAFAMQALAHRDWDLVILGDGPERDRLQARIDAAGLAGRIHLPGRAGNMPLWYQRADLYVMSSRFEGFPNTLLEALMYGVPAVSFDCDTGPRDIIDHEVNGLLVPRGDAGRLSAAMGRLMSDGDLRGKLAMAAHDVKKRYAIDKIEKKWAVLFGELLNADARK